MSEHQSEQELRSLFREHMPLRPMPMDLAERLRHQVLTEVANTIKVAQLAEPTLDQPLVGVAPVAKPPSARTQPNAKRAPAPRAGIGAWLIDRLRLAPSLALTGAAIAALIAILSLGPRLLPILTTPSTGSQPGTVQTANSNPGTSTPAAVASANLTATGTSAAAPSPSAGEANPAAGQTPTTSDATATTIAGLTNATKDISGGSDGPPSPTATTAGSNPNLTWGTSNFATPATSTASTPVSSGPPSQTTNGVAPKVSATPATSNNPSNGRTATPTASDGSGMIVKAATATPQRSSSALGVVTPTATGSLRLELGDVQLTPSATAIPNKNGTPTAAPSATPTSGQLAVGSPKSTPTKVATATSIVKELVSPIATMTAAPSGTKPASTATPVVGSIGGLITSPTPTYTPVPPTATPTLESTATFTPVPPTATPTDTPTYTPVPPTATPTDTPTYTPVPPTATPTDTPTYTPVPPTATPTDTPTYTPVPPTATPTATETDTPVPPTATETSTITPTATYTPTPTDAPLPTDTPVLTPSFDGPVPANADAPVGQIFQYQFVVLDPGGGGFIVEVDPPPGNLFGLPSTAPCEPSPNDPLRHLCRLTSVPVPDTISSGSVFSVVLTLTDSNGNLVNDGVKSFTVTVK